MSRKSPSWVPRPQQFLPGSRRRISSAPETQLLSDRPSHLHQTGAVCHPGELSLTASYLLVEMLPGKTWGHHELKLLDSEWKEPASISSSAMDSPHGRWASPSTFHLETGAELIPLWQQLWKLWRAFLQRQGCGQAGTRQGLHVAVRQLLAPSVEGISHMAWRLQKWSESVPSTQRTCTSETIYRPGFSWAKRKF